MLSACSLALPLVSQSPIGTAPETMQDLHLVQFADDNQSLRDELIESGGFYGDLGAYGIARIDAKLRAEITPRAQSIAEIPPVHPGEVLLFAARTRAGAGPMHGRLLLARRAFYLTAAKPDQVPEGCRGSGFHGGLQALTLDRPYQPATEVAPRPTHLVPDPAITAMVNQVSQANLQTHVTQLSNIFSRRTTRTENAQAVTYVTGLLRQLPNITFRTETFRSGYGPNIIAELRGTDLPNEIVMVGAHLDSIVGGNSAARSPGADDNASGSSATLEMARIFSTKKFRRTIRFGWWNAEELGLVGSNAYAQAARSRGDNIIAYVNTDMNAYRRSGDTVSLDFVNNDSTTSLVNRMVATIATYLPTLRVNRGNLSGGTSDHRSFFRAGFPAAFPFEDIGNYSPFIHTTNDTIGTSANDFNLSKLITQAITASMADLAEVSVANPGRFQSFGTGCRGTGTIPSQCGSLNPNGGTLTNQTRTNEYSYQVVSSGSKTVKSFEVFTQSTGGNVTVGAHLYASSGNGPATTPIASTTMTVGPTAGFYKATLTTPTAVNGTFYIAMDHSSSTTIVSTLSAGAGGIGYYRRTPTSGTWTQSSLVARPSFKVECTGGTNNAVPRLGNQGVAVINRSYSLTLEFAKPSASAALLLGSSNTRWAGGNLPVAIPGAPGCSLLVSAEVSDNVSTDANGRASKDLALPNMPALIGASIYHQWVVVDSAANSLGIAMSNGGQSTIGG